MDARSSGHFCTSIDLGSVDVSRVRLEGIGRFRMRNKLRKLFDEICNHCPNLETLTVPNASLLDDDLHQIFVRLQHLKTLNMEKMCRTPEGCFTGESFSEAPSSLKEIRIHVANYCPCLTDEALKIIANKTNKTLTLFKLYSDWDNFVGEKALSYFLDRCSNLTTLKLGCLGREAGENLSSSCLEKLGKLKNLKILYLWAARISSSVIQCLVDGCELLTSLEFHTEIMDLEALTDISRFKSLTDLRLDVINGLPWATLLPTYSRNNANTLKILALNAIHAAELPQILELFPGLEQLCLWNSVDVRASTLANAINQFKESKSTHLKLIASCYQVQLDQNLISALQNAPQFTVGCYYEHRPCDLVNSG